MDRAGPLVAVCLAPTDLRPEIDDLTGGVRADPRRSDLNPAEAAALEHGLRVADAWGGWVLAVAAGGAEIDDVLREVRALGVEVVRVGSEPHTAPASDHGPAPVPSVDLAGDPAGVATAVAAAIRSYGDPSLVLCGDRSGAQGVGAVPALIAHELGLDQALGLVSVSVQGSRGLVVERRLDGGWRERLAVKGPAVLSVEAAGVRLRRASLEAALNVDTGPVPVEPAPPRATPGEVRVGATRPYRPRPRTVPAPSGEPHERLLALTGALSSREPARVVGPVDAERAVDELLEYLRRFGYTD